MFKNIIWFFFIFSINLNFSQEIITVSRPETFENITDTSYSGKSKVLKSINKNKNSGIKIPYPILFIHGLNSNSNTWNIFTDFLDTQFNFTYGGRFDFCLNYNSNNSSSNLNFPPTANADIAQFTNSTIVGDYYYINFDVGNNGIVAPSTSSSAYVISNQSSIYKQGRALSRAISQILTLTGKEKVILVGHSMGGLASREHIQNANNWINNNHKVAKQISVGTPHGGSNSSLSVLTGLFTGIDEKSEAIRDLRTSYFYNGNPGVYLFGGQENNNYMFDMLLSNFYNTDVNCNGITNETILGLNQKALPIDLDYACIIGTGWITGGDGVVSAQDANINTFYPNVTTNIVSSPTIHTSLQTLPLENMMALDEPNEHNLAYKLEVNKSYKGFSNLQMQSSNTIDQDYFYFNISQPSNVVFNITNITIPVMVANIGTENNIAIGNSYANNNQNSISFNQNLNPGTYKLLISSIFPNANSHLNPYNINITATLNQENFDTNKVIFYPNPTKNLIYFDNSITKFTKLNIYDSIGKLVQENSINEFATEEKINMETLASGVYKIVLQNENNSIIETIIKE